MRHVGPGPKKLLGRPLVGLRLPTRGALLQMLGQPHGVTWRHPPMQVLR
jgi:hypothetical protein